MFAKKLLNSVLIPVLFFSFALLQLPPLATLPLMQTPTANAAFVDVEPGEAHYVAITYLQENGIISGYADGTFKPYQKINRAEALKMITLANGVFTDENLEEPDPENTLRPFTDTPLEEWYTKYLIAAKEQGFIDGYEDGSFKPTNNINLAEALKILLESSPDIAFLGDPENYLYNDTPLEAWFINYTAYANWQGLLNISLDNMAHPEQEMTRGYLAEIIYRKLMYKNQYKFGAATFYGAAVQGSGTASGETFDLNAFTAAHKTLPFGTIVEVTNLANGQKVEVKINDRGPYGPGRVLDLSSAAFKEIGSLSSGIIYVQYKVISSP